MDPEQRRWIQERVEQPHSKPPARSSCGSLLNQAEAFETFLQTKFVGQKRFSLEGGETTIPLLDEICEAAAEADLDEVCIGMAHRGRLNVLANIVGKKYSQIFREFEGNIDPHGPGLRRREVPPRRRGRVPLRLGDRIKVSVAANPSHLEAVDPVLEGIARAKQDVLDRGAEYPCAAARPRRRVRRPGRRGRDPEPLPAARLPHRRHDPRGRQQPGRLHHLARLVAVQPLLHRRGADGPGADLPRQRRRPRGLHPGAAWPSSTARRSTRTSSSTWSATAAAATTRATTRRTPSSCTTSSSRSARSASSTPSPSSAVATSRSRRPSRCWRDYQQQLERVFTEVREATRSLGVDDRPGLPRQAGRRATTAVTPEVLKRIADAYVTPPDGFTVHPKVMPQLQRRSRRSPTARSTGAPARSSRSARC